LRKILNGPKQTANKVDNRLIFDCSCGLDHLPSFPDCKITKLVQLQHLIINETPKSLKFQYFVRTAAQTQSGPFQTTHDHRIVSSFTSPCVGTDIRTKHIRLARIIVNSPLCLKANLHTTELLCSYYTSFLVIYCRLVGAECIQLCLRS